MAGVFISYASADHEMAQKEVVGLVKALGFETWFAPENIRSADFWEKSIMTGLESSDWFVVIVSKAAAKSAWVKRELNWAFENLAQRIIPIVIDGCESRKLDERLPSVHHLDYGADRTTATHQLAKRLTDAEHRGSERDLTGRWLCALQPVYYSRFRRHIVEGAGKRKRVAHSVASGKDGDWHIQKVEISRSAGGFLVDAVPAKGTLQWRWEASLVANAFLTGRWKSKRKSSGSHGFMSVQISRNGMYMFGHDHAVVMEEGKAHYGVLLFGENKSALEKAWSAMKEAQRPMPPLTCRIDFPEWC